LAYIDTVIHFARGHTIYIHISGGESMPAKKNVAKAARKLARKNSSAEEKSEASKVLNEAKHQ